MISYHCIDEPLNWRKSQHSHPKGIRLSSLAIVDVIPFTTKTKLVSKDVKAGQPFQTTKFQNTAADSRIVKAGPGEVECT
jgi:hypothetical protein